MWEKICDEIRTSDGKEIQGRLSERGRQSCAEIQDAFCLDQGYTFKVWHWLSKANFNNVMNSSETIKPYNILGIKN